MSSFDNTPIIVAVAQQTWRDQDPSRTPVDALHEVAAAAIADANNDKLAGALDGLAMVRFIADTNPDVGALFPRNPGKQVAERLGIKGVSIYQGTIGGNTPQYLVNHMANKLAAAEHRAVLLAGAELLSTLFGALGTGGDISAWPGAPEAEPETIGTERDGLNDAETRAGLYEPINTYPLFENSLRRHLGSDTETHQAHIASICSTMSAVAANNPHAWRTRFQTAEDVATVSDKNRFIAYPYTKAMNPILAVDMAAAVIMTTVGTARELGIEPSQWIYLRGGVDVNDIWHLTERPSLHESPAIRLAWNTLASTSGIDIDDVTDFDIYSCFPSAVQVACREIGLSPLDPRGVTVTGGLPYLGGPGNNYSLHAIAEMACRLRDRGSAHGLVTANGLYLTKHSLGLYSTEAGDKPWQPADNSHLQSLIENGPRLAVPEDPEGSASVESFTVGFDRNGPSMGIIAARNHLGQRVFANTASDERSLNQLLAADPMGQQGNIIVRDGQNVFEF